MTHSRRRGGYRSGLEEKIVAQLTAAAVVFYYEPLAIPYVPSKPRKYTPDLVLQNGVVVEAKGHFLSEDRSKHKAIKAQYPDLDLRFVFARPLNRLGTTSRTTYAQWAETHGYLWAEKFIPTAWLRELPNEQSLAVLRGLGMEL